MSLWILSAGKFGKKYRIRFNLPAFTDFHISQFEYIYCDVFFNC